MPGVEPVPEDLHLDAAQTVAMADQLFAQGRAFAAHEVFEAAWKDSGDGTELGQVWRGLAQLMVAVTHAQRGNDVGARALFARADATLAEVCGQTGVDVAKWRRRAQPYRPSE